MTNKKDVILPLGASVIAFIIFIFLLYSLFLGIGIFLIVYGLSVSIGLVVISSLFICLSGIMFISFNIWIIYLLRLEFKGDMLILNYFSIVAKMIKRTQYVVLISELKIVESLSDKSIRFTFKDDSQKIWRLQSFSKKQIPKIILEVTSKAQIVSGCNIEAVK